MVGSMRDNTKTIKSKDLEYSHFVTVESMKENGKMENNMVEVYFARRIWPAKASGRTGKGSNG